MLLVPSVQVKHQGSDQSPRIRSSFKVQVKVHGFQYPIHPGKASMFRSPSYGHSFYLLLVSAIQVKCQGPDFPAMGIVIQVKHLGSDRQSMVIAIQDKHQGSDLPAMAIVIQVKHLGSDRQSMVKGIKQHYGRILTSFNLVLVSSHPGQASRFYSPVHGVFQIKHQGSDLPAIVIDLIYLQSPAIQIKHQDSDLPAMVIVSSYPGQASRFPSPRHGYSSSLRPSRSSFKVLISRYMVIDITKIDEQSHSALFISSVESTKIMLHGSGFSPWL
ncbi:hypothetical protein PHYBLDRAFT_65718 [Phycomyces blakesleeanus NRRL 1555(-)]|uniref:Uncharacterized protein n=1 Tax=Phycomyces blakesleeanus (strain ATCC 8743b / DSM 1359 / FGSC 10004 / NBRC 33097 / NRRL 1555) TaxID=763407 RepID=A0A163DM00_PHYB8|nr:hypothetical protein PHYBLDRAFT_65718 [Phycomyces blakesleeanus NRRL 1555(-)]OAD72240.1 hypothetical protein PHYBLDRAFT_65718 [Phycomyces blakesleeanus NRRL 1555(-)]|eukprot:XP_018290280.1 hypothetical protein PHYBLDRAFT_65718 [Phycomyces blakesleeanus NRRL 1555(-)]